MDFDRWYDLNEEHLLGEFLLEKRERLKRHILLCAAMEIEFDEFVKGKWEKVTL